MSPVALPPTLARALVACAVAAVACESSDEPPIELAMPTTGGETIEAPSFIDPASGTLAFDVTRTTDIVLQVAAVERGRTDLVIDGVKQGDLGPTATFGTLTESELRVRLRGAMVPGTHRMTLQTRLDEELLISEEIEVVVRPTAPVDLVATLDGPEFPTRMVTGSGDNLIAALDDSGTDAPRLTVVRGLAEDAEWDWTDARTVSLPGYAVGHAELGMAVSVALVGSSDDDRLRVAWRVGSGSAVHLLDTRWDDAAPDTPDFEVLGLTAEVTGPVEYAAFGRPLLLGDVLLGELFAATDVESPRPGDHAVIRVPLSSTPGVVGTAQRVSFGQRQDIDRLGPAMDVLRRSGDAHVFSARLDQRRPVVVAVDPDDGLLSLRSARGESDADTFVESTTPLLTATGAFGSRLVSATDSSAVRLLRAWDLSGQDHEAFGLTSADLPDPSALTGDPALTILGGAPTLLLPYGSAEPLHAIMLTDDVPTITSIPALHCSSVAAPGAPADPGATTIPLACALDGQLLRASLEVVEPR